MFDTLRSQVVLINLCDVNDITDVHHDVLA